MCKRKKKKSHVREKGQKVNYFSLTLSYFLQFALYFKEKTSVFTWVK